MKKLLYSGMIIVCLAAVTMPAMAKGKPQKQQKPQKTEKIYEQPSSTNPNPLPCQQQSPLDAATKASNLRSNKGGKLRGQARAAYVHQLNQAKKQQRLAGQVPNACTGLPQLPPRSTTTPLNSTTSTSQTSTSVEVNTEVNTLK